MLWNGSRKGVDGVHLILFYWNMCLATTQSVGWPPQSLIQFQEKRSRQIHFLLCVCRKHTHNIYRCHFVIFKKQADSNVKDLNTNTEQIAGRYMIMINENKKNDNSTLNNNTGPDRNISVVMFNTNSICEIRHYTSGCIFASRKLCEQENSHFCWNENIEFTQWGINDFLRHFCYTLTTPLHTGIGTRILARLH